MGRTRVQTAGHRHGARVCYASMKHILVTGATGQIGREVVSQLRATGCRIRALSRNPRGASLPRDVEMVPGDLSAPDTLDACLNDIDTVFLVWVAPLAAAAPAIQRIAAHAGQIVLLTSPHRTPHPFFQQPNALRFIHSGVEQLIEASGLHWTFLRPGPFAINCRNWSWSCCCSGLSCRSFRGTSISVPPGSLDPP